MIAHRDQDKAPTLVSNKVRYTSLRQSLTVNHSGWRKSIDSQSSILSDHRKNTVTSTKKLNSPITNEYPTDFPELRNRIMTMRLSGFNNEYILNDQEILDWERKTSKFITDYLNEIASQIFVIVAFKSQNVGVYLFHLYYYFP